LDTYAESSSCKVIGRRATARDEKRWRESVDGYCVFRTPSEAPTRHTWERIMDDVSPIHAIVAEKRNEGVVGVANYVIHCFRRMPKTPCKRRVEPRI
jgi:hypothetical protein